MADNTKLLLAAAAGATPALALMALFFRLASSSSIDATPSSVTSAVLPNRCAEEKSFLKASDWSVSVGRVALWIVHALTL